ncbi:MAG: carboxylating nicotinate-nucleotide diphosphorylase, partial [Desulfobulbaceae bacterium]|nr:carboxylating nicotinate-nucleotide diphosphorylase [Desulfobulbaceae bacterium]
FIAKEPFIAAGIRAVAAEVFVTQNPAITITNTADDGANISIGDVILVAQGPVVDLLQAERVALNLVQRLSGIATLTNRFAAAVSPLPVKIVDTRKTTPGLRVLEKYAVRVGGGHNHRFNLADGVLIKDNHIAACGSIKAAVERAREQAPHTLKIEVEAENITQVEECLACGVDIIMLDNMNPEQLREAVKIAKGKALLEASGGVNLDNVRQIAETGIDIISIGALTHSAPAVDISMRLTTK